MTVDGMEVTPYTGKLTEDVVGKGELSDVELPTEVDEIVEEFTIMLVPL